MKHQYLIGYIDSENPPMDEDDAEFLIYEAESGLRPSDKGLRAACLTDLKTFVDGSAEVEEVTVVFMKNLNDLMRYESPSI